MSGLTEIFAHVCGQGRCFLIDGAVLPVCQRCLGLYVGAAITGTWLAISGVWRRGLPGRIVVLTNSVMLLVAMAGGTHVIDPGPRWRLFCGLWEGHVVIFWLVVAAAHLHYRSRLPVPTQASWSWRDRVGALVLGLALAMLAVGFPALRWLGWYPWATIVAIGAVMVSVSLLVAIAVAAVSLLPHSACRDPSLRERHPSHP